MNADHACSMRIALALARRNLGQTWPNPSVGAILVKDGHIVGQGVTAKGGRPHAETIAIAQAGELARGATLYVTLEPCAHQGSTPPCTEAIIAAGIARCVIACTDPNPLVQGKGITQLRAAGIDIVEQVCTEEAREVNRGFFSIIEKNRPFISLKLATSLDGCMATASGDSQWITGEKARAFGQLLRSQYDAVATGIGTVLADNPALTCRLPGLEDRSPVRIIFDSQQRLPTEYTLAASAKATPTWLISTQTAENPQLQACSITFIPCAARENGQIELHTAMAALAERGITRLLVEGGAALTTAFLHSGLVDRIYWFRAALVIGSDGLHAIGAGFPSMLSQLARWQYKERMTLTPDTVDIIECLPAL